MGDRVTIYDSLKCGHCGKPQEWEVYFAPSSGFLTHQCDKCGKENKIVETYELQPITAAEKKKIYKEFSGETLKP